MLSSAVFQMRSGTVIRAEAHRGSRNDPMPSEASSLEAIKAILPDVRSRRMMGEYLLYMDGKLFGGIYDGRLLLKITKASAGMLRDFPPDHPYEGGQEMIRFTEPYDADLLRKVVAAMCEELPSRKRGGRSFIVN